MFRCGRCNKTTDPREKQTKVVAMTREASYPRREYYAQGRMNIDPGGFGVETVKEMNICERCAEEING